MNLAHAERPKETLRDSSRADDEFRVRLVELIPHLRAFARTLCQDRDVAEDLAQESVTSAWQARASFRPGTNMKAWLFVIQRNAYYSAYRRKWREVGWDDLAMDAVMTTGAPQHANADLTDLGRAMALLPDGQREALILVGAGGFTYDEAAAICSCAVGTMKSRVARARRALANSMDDTASLPRPREGAISAYQAITHELDVLSLRKNVARS